MSRRRQPITFRPRTPLWLFGLAVVVVLAVGIVILMTNRESAMRSQPVEFPHIHGLGFSSDGTQLYVPAHIGLIVFENNMWRIPEIPAHDYMGYSAVDTGFYSSGHPDLRTDFPPLLGLVKSEDEGHSIQSLAFGGESDFHLMSAGYYSHTVYVINSEPNSGLSTGLYYTIDDGQVWEQSQAQGLGGSPSQLAVHPTLSETVAIATDTGLYLSGDHGNTFTRIGNAAPVSAVSFNPLGNILFWGYQNLSTYDMVTGETETLTPLSLPSNDAISHIAINPATSEVAIATFLKDIYLSQNNHQSWQQIAMQGIGQSG